jgi:hypothetical protein
LNRLERIDRQVAMAMIHINRNRENIGKFNDQDVADGLKSGRFLPTDLAWREPTTKLLTALLRQAGSNTLRYSIS